MNYSISVRVSEYSVASVVYQFILGMAPGPHEISNNIKYCKMNVNSGVQ